MGVVGFALAFAFGNWGLAHSTASNAALLITVEPTTLLVLAPLLLGERLSRRETVGAALTLLGAVVVVVNGVPGLTQSLMRHWRGDLVLILSGVAYAGYSLVGGDVLTSHQVSLVTAHSVVWGAVSIAPLALYEWHVGPPPAWTAGAIAGTVYLGVVITALGYGVWNWCLERVGAARVAAFVNVQPLAGALLGVWWLREPLTPFLVVGGGRIVAGTNHKRSLPNYGVFDENRYFQSGEEAPVFTLGETVIAANICEDIWYPTGPTTLQALGGAELVVSINASPYHAGKGRFREKMLATRAADDLVCLAFVNTVGGQDELIFDGQSFMFNEKGECVARGKAFEEDFVVADLDLDEVFRARLHDSRRRKEKLRATEAPPRRVTLPPLPAPERPGLPAHDVAVLEPVEEIYQALVLGARDYVTKNGFRHVVLGLSGGIDSSLVAAIACDALGPANVTGVTMSSQFSSKGTRADAARLARNLGIEFLRLPITPVLNAYRRALARPFKGLNEGVTDIVARGFDAATVKRVIAMVDRNEYKRRQGPIGIKITPRAFGKDWRLPIVNRFRE